MGKGNRIKREREAAARRAAEAAAQKSASADGADSGRRNFLKRGAMIASGIALAGVTAYELGKKDEDDIPSSPEYLSVNEAVEVYHNLQKTVERKWKEAQRQKKPLRIFVLEEHESVNALAYELMLLDITNRLGIRTLLPEIGRNTVQELLNVDPNIDPPMLANKERVMQAAHEKKYTIENIDTRYATQEEHNQAYFNLTKRFAEEELNKRYQRSDIVVSIIPPNDINSLLFGYKISENNPFFNTAQEMENGVIVGHAREKAYAATHDERNKAMLATIKRFGSAMVIAGEEHGIGLLTPLRGDHEIDVTFNVTDKALESRDQNSLIMDAEMKKRMEWVNSPANALQYRGKEFDPKDTQDFVTKVIAKANKRGMSLRR